MKHYQHSLINCSRLLLSAVLVMLTFTGCKKEGSVRNLFVFAEKKDVLTRVIIDLKGDEEDAIGLDLSDARYLREHLKVLIVALLILTAA